MTPVHTMHSLLTILDVCRVSNSTQFFFSIRIHTAQIIIILHNNHSRIEAIRYYCFALGHLLIDILTIVLHFYLYGLA